ncbi:DNA primase small subunit PriS [Halocalculus aciditolerans]|uniref:DNA primase small subunit PriS n=1 Tax=Halocalculus aciditolerans TaxID=1383812 RepID=A0A830F9V8_9EURY|nr:DNA primase small subunit PriS [Halocalculus aciditolerans]GGL53485.1 DNA primase [Halocalculus aciditolerans]
MEERTRAYLRGRFRDYYRRVDVELPPGAEAREWGYIPWTSGPDTTMVRHKSVLDIGNVQEFLQRERPRHVYFSGGYYDDPGARTMGEKGWRGADVVFDIDADHLPQITPGEDSYAEMLEAGKQALLKLLDFLERDFGFTDVQCVFSGGRGYHAHVRDERVRKLDRQERREIVDYVRGNGIELDALSEKQMVGGRRLKNPVEKKTLPTDGGWGRRVNDYVNDYVDDLREMDDDEARLRLQTFDGVGEGRANAILNVVEDRREEIRQGNIELGGAYIKLVRQLLGEAVDEYNAPIDEPVTTDTNRLIRFPGTLHGGSGLRVLRLDESELEAFDPLVDAVPDTFVGHDITVEVTANRTVELRGETLTVEPGVVSIPEYAGIYLMARGWAEKAKE